MKRKNLNFAIDAVSLLVMLAMVVTGIVIHYLLPAGSGGRGGTGKLTLWGGGRHEWGEVHFWLAIATVVLIVVHLVLHWAWICAVVAGWFRKGRGGAVERNYRHLYGFVSVVAAMVLVGGLVALGAFSVEEPRGGHSCEGDGRGDGHGRGGGGHGAVTHRYGNDGHDGHGGAGNSEIGHIRGSMTLAQVAAQTGIAASALKRRLGLPANTANDERLGRLRQLHGFAMADLRSVIGELSERPGKR